jgi:hypothetical protein
MLDCCNSLDCNLVPVVASGCGVPQLELVFLALLLPRTEFDVLEEMLGVVVVFLVVLVVLPELVAVVMVMGMGVE